MALVPSADSNIHTIFLALTFLVGATTEQHVIFINFQPMSYLGLSTRSANRHKQKYWHVLTLIHSVKPGEYGITMG